MACEIQTVSFLHKRFDIVKNHVISLLSYRDLAVVKDIVLFYEVKSTWGSLVVTMNIYECIGSFIYHKILHERGYSLSLILSFYPWWVWVFSNLPYMYALRFVAQSRVSEGEVDPRNTTMILLLLLLIGFASTSSQKQRNKFRVK